MGLYHTMEGTLIIAAAKKDNNSFPNFLEKINDLMAGWNWEIANEEEDEITLALYEENTSFYAIEDLKNVINSFIILAKEYKCEMSGEFSWKDENDNSGRFNIETINGEIVMTSEQYTRDELAIRNSSDEVLLTELKKRGYTVFKNV